MEVFLYLCTYIIYHARKGVVIVICEKNKHQIHNGIQFQGN